MNEHLRERILRKLDSLPDERGYQILDYVEFLESRYAERSAPSASPFTRFAEVVEDRLRAGKVSATTIAEAMNLMNRATGVLNGALAAGRSVANDIVTATRPAPAPPSGASGSRHAAGRDAGAERPAQGGWSTDPEDLRAPNSSGTVRAGLNTTSDAESADQSSAAAHDLEMPGSGEEKL